MFGELIVPAWANFKAKWAAKERQGKRTDLVETFYDVGGGKTRDKLAEFARTSARTLNRPTAVVEAAEAQPEKLRHLKLGHYGMP